MIAYGVSEQDIKSMEEKSKRRIDMAKRTILNFMKSTEPHVLVQLRNSYERRIIHKFCEEKGLKTYIIEWKDQKEFIAKDCEYRPVKFIQVTRN